MKLVSHLNNCGFPTIKSKSLKGWVHALNWTRCTYLITESKSGMRLASSIHCLRWRASFLSATQSMVIWSMSKLRHWSSRDFHKLNRWILRWSLQVLEKQPKKWIDHWVKKVHARILQTKIVFRCVSIYIITFTVTSIFWNYDQFMAPPL